MEIKIGKNVNIHPDSKINIGVKFGNNVTIYEKVIVDKGVTILDGAVIGRQPMATSTLNRKISTPKIPLTIGEGSIIGANCVLYAGIKIGKHVLIGDLSSIREGCTISDNVVVGRGVLIMYDSFVGKRSRIIDGAIITGNMKIEEDVFIGPGVNSINDNAPVYLTRFGINTLKVKGPTVKRYALIGAGANLNAEIVIGKGSIVAPNSMVTHDVKPWTVVAGIPAHKIRNVDPLHKTQILNHFKSK